MKLRALSVVLAMALAPVGGWAQTAPPVPAPDEATDQIAALSQVLMIDAVIEVMRDEGIAYGSDLADEMFPGQGGPGWQSVVAAIYEPRAMRAQFDTTFRATLTGSADEVAAIEAFFASELGQRVLTLEIEARRALLDDVVEEAATLAYAEIEAEGGPRLAALKAFIDTNMLVDSNVMGALNANLAFYQGMAEVESFGEAMPEDQMLAEVWAQEPDIRTETEDWLHPYLALAYKPLSDDDLRAYEAFSASSAGQAVNTALFAAFDAMFVSISRDLGRAVARQMQGQEL